MVPCLVTIAPEKWIQVSRIMKVDCKVYKGIEYVQLSDLPDDQRQALVQALNPDLYIKILIDGKIVSGCLQYKHYLSWYLEYTKLLTGKSEPSPVSSVDRPTKLTLNKA